MQFKFKLNFFYFEHLTFKMLTLLESKVKERAKVKDVEYVHHLEITEVFLVYFNVRKMIINKNQGFCIHLCLMNHLFN